MRILYAVHSGYNEGGEIIARRGGLDPELTKLTQDGKWILQGGTERGINISSWYCELTTE